MSKLGQAATADKSRQTYECLLQAMDATGDKQASDTAISGLLGRLSKHVIDATPTCEEQESTIRNQRSGAKRQPLASCMNSALPVKVSITVPSQESSQLGTMSKVRFKGMGARIVMPVDSDSRVRSVSLTTIC